MQTTWRWLRVIAPIVVFLPVILACPTRPLENPVSKTTKEDIKYYPQSVEKDIDLLFVIDNSDSMKEEQENLGLQFPKLIDALRSPQLGGEGCSETNIGKCNIPNIRIGVVSSDLGAGNYVNLTSCEVPGGDGGRLQDTQRIAGCSTPNDPWIQYVEGQTNIPNSSGDAVQDVKDSFKCIAMLGRNGCGFEHQLEAARRALDPQLNVNPGFLRPEAFLAIVFITDEDDCSAQKPVLFDPTQQGLTDPLGPLSSFRCFEFGINCDKGGRQPGPRQDCRPGGDYLYKVDDYANFFANVKSEGRMIMFAIAGPTQPLKDVPFEHQPTAEVGLKNGNPDLSPSCESPQGKGVPAIRIQALVEHQALADKGHKGYFNGITRPERLLGEKETVHICDSDFGPALRQLGEVIVATLGGQCLTSPPLTPNGSVACWAGDSLGGDQTCGRSCLDQVECVIEEVTGQGTSAEKRTSVPKCPSNLFEPGIPSDQCGSNCPCWRIIPTDECDEVKHGSPYGLNVMRVGEAEKGTMAVAKCQTSPFSWGSQAFLDLGQCD